MSGLHTEELELLERICERIVATGKLPSEEYQNLPPSFKKRFENAVKSVEDRAVSRYAFLPSGRIVWTVRGRSGEYQIMPETNFCSCDDFYFRVMGYKRQMCYHMIAQRIAGRLGLYNEYELRDSDYDRLTEKWRAKEPSETNE